MIILVVTGILGGGGGHTQFIRGIYSARVESSTRFPMAGQTHQPHVGVLYMIIRIPGKGGMTIRNIRSLNPGTSLTHITPTRAFYSGGIMHFKC